MDQFLILGEVFYKVCADGNVEGAQRLLQTSQINVNWQNHHDSLKTPFYVAIILGHIEIVKLLLNDPRVDVNKGTKLGWTPFIVACYGGKIEVVKYMFASGRDIDINKRDDDDGKKKKPKGQTGLDIAREREHIALVQLIESFQRNPNEIRENLRRELPITEMKAKLWKACFDGNVEDLRILLQNEQIDITWEYDHGITVFSLTCAKGHIEVVKLLLSNERVDINKVDNNGWTSFHGACALGQTEVVKYLFESGREIDINKRTLEGKTGLDYAKEKGSMDIVELIDSFQKRMENEKIKLEVEKKFKEEKGKLEDERKKIENQRKKLEEENKRKESKKSTYDIEYINDTYILKTTAKTLTELENDVKSKLKLEENVKIRLYFKRNEKFIVLDDIEDLKEGMTIKVLTSTQLQSDSSFSSSSSSLSLSNLTITDSTNVNNECWWNTKPNEKTKWEEKGFQDTRYLRYLLRDNKQNVVDNGNEYLKKLEILMAFFGGDMNQINKAYVLFNEKLFDSFQHHRSSLFNQQRASPTIFKKDDWKNGNDLGQKFKFHDHYSKMAEGFDWNHSKFLHAIPMIHGTNETALQEICQTGLAATGATDPGYYGQGMYFSSSLFYSSKYTKDSPDGKPFIICMITPGNVYPVTEVPYLEGPAIQVENPQGFVRRPCKLGYQSHYTLVDKRKHVDAYPVTGNIDENVANELVVFEKAQVVPLFAIYYK